MGKITKIETQKKNKKRVNLYIDGEFALGLYKETIVKQSLYAGKEINKSQLFEIKYQESINEAKEKVRNYLTYRDRSKKEIRDYLKVKEFEEDIINDVIENFEEAGLLNDHAFAMMWIKDRNIRNPRGNFLLKMEMEEKGISSDDIEAALTIVDERKNALSAAKKARRKYTGKNDIKRRMYEYLARRGFPSYLLREAIDEVLREND